MSKITLARAVLVWSLLCSFVLAQHRFDFIDDSNQFVATLELSKLPATHEDFVSLTFGTPEGLPIGFGMNYSGTFDEMSSPDAQIVSSDAGGLTGTDSGSDQVLSNFAFAFMRDLDPPELLPSRAAAVLPDGAEVISFDLYASEFDSFRDVTSTDDFNLKDRMQVNFRLPDGTESEFGVAGFWQPVPEPFANVLAIFATIGLLGIRIRRQSLI